MHIMTTDKIKTFDIPPPPAFQPGQWVLYQGQQYKVIAGTDAHAQLEGIEQAIAIWQLEPVAKENEGLIAIDELTSEELAERHRLELKVERAFYEAGKALAELRSRRLYRSSHKTFEAYCHERFGFQRRHPYQLIEAAAVVDNLCASSAQILPTSEYQVRSLTALEPEEQCQVWQEAINQAGGKVPASRIVKGIVERLKEKPLQTTASYNVGDAFTLTGLSGPERKYNGCWAIALSVHNFTVEVDVHDAVLIVKPDNLNQIDLPDAQRQLPVTLKRIKRLRDCGLLDRGAYNVLEDLGRHIYLTEVEEILLAALEKYYGFE